MLTIDGYISNSSKLSERFNNVMSTLKQSEQQKDKSLSILRESQGIDKIYFYFSLI